MASPEIKIIAVSNVFCRLMNFVNAGDIEQGHKHTYDHATLVSSGSVRVEVLNDDGTIASSKEFVAPSMVFIHKDRTHKLVALEDNTVCSCIHAIRDVEGQILDPEFLIEPVNSENKGELRQLVSAYTCKPMMPFTSR